MRLGIVGFTSRPMLISQFELQSADAHASMSKRCEAVGPGEVSGPSTVSAGTDAGGMRGEPKMRSTPSMLPVAVLMVSVPLSASLVSGGPLPVMLIVPLTLNTVSLATASEHVAAAASAVSVQRIFMGLPVPLAGLVCAIRYSSPNLASIMAGASMAGAAQYVKTEPRQVHAPMVLGLRG